jgi:hypothetical protein
MPTRWTANTGLDPEPFLDNLAVGHLALFLVCATGETSRGGLSVSQLKRLLLASPPLRLSDLKQLYNKLPPPAVPHLHRYQPTHFPGYTITQEELVDTRRKSKLSFYRSNSGRSRLVKATESSY